MIPKKIHYCWFGNGKKSRLVKKCIDSWKRYCPDYELIEWNETNFDVSMNEYTKMCYEQKKYAFLSDYARLYLVCEYGGIYLDTDVELLKSPDDLLKQEAFFGFETDEYVASGLGFGSVSHGIVIEAMLKEYNFLLDGKQDVVGCPILNTRALEKFGLKKNGKLQELNGTVIYPVEYFNPYEWTTGRLKKTENTVSIHWYAAGWMSHPKKIRKMITKPLHRIFGVDALQRFRK